MGLVKTTTKDARARDLVWSASDNAWLDEAASKALRATKTAENTMGDLTQDVLKFKNTDFNFSTDNPYLKSMKSYYGQNVTEQKGELARQMAAKGVTDSGQMLRAQSRLNAQNVGAMQQLTGQDYARQLNEWKDTNQNRWAQAMGKYQVAGDAYKNAMDTYYQNLALEQEKALAEYQKKNQNGYDWGAGGKGAVAGASAGFTVGSAFTPIGGLIGAGAGALIGGLSGIR